MFFADGCFVLGVILIEYIQVGNLGKNRDKFISKVNQKVGKGNWYWSFRAGDKLYSWEWGMQLYEDAYYQFFRQDASKLKDIVGYSNVFVYNRHDLDSGLDYKRQSQESDHCADIAIRRCLVRFGVWFHGKEILSLKGSAFDPVEVKFHLPHLVNKPDKLKSIQSWINSNRLIVVTPTIEDQFRLAELMVK